MALQLVENRGILRLPAMNGISGWRPINDAQYTFINCRAQLALFGGQSGGGKSNVLVADSAQEYDNPYFRGILLRKSFSEMTNIMDEMERIYRPLGGRPSDGKKIWKFPSGAIMRLGYMANDTHVELYTGKPISWLGIDEAQFQTEDRVRKLFPWVSTPPEYGLRDRIRLTANPSAPWLMALFLNNHCPVHHPDKSTIAGAVYGGARWKKDDGPVMLTTCFIPAKLADNPLYGEQKKAMLMSQTADVRRKLLDGCWCNVEGAFFPFWDDSYVVPYSECGEQWWHTHFISQDYGYSSSAAAAGLYFMHDNGKIFKIMEIVERQMQSEEWARHLVANMALRTIRGQRIRLIDTFADPAMDAHTGTGRSNLELIRDVFSPYDINITKAAKDSVGNAQLLSGKLQRREYCVTDMCPQTAESISSRKNDPDRPGAILKVKGDELDDIIDTDLYGLNTFIQANGKPTQETINERVAEMAAAGADERTLHVARFRMEREAEQYDAPQSWVRPTIGKIGARR